VIAVNSNTTGTSTISATASLDINGVHLTRSLGDSASGDSAKPTKTWVDAQIQISGSAVNEVGHEHLFTVTVNKDTGTGTFVPAPGATVTFSASAPGSIVAADTTCSSPTDASGQCVIAVNSSKIGTSTISATASLTVNGVPLSRSLGDESSGDSAKPTKTWVDANIQITPPTADNPVGTTHTLTVTVNAVNGTFDAGTYTVTGSIASGPGSFVNNANTCTFSGGSAIGTCNLVITSATTGTTKVHATVTAKVAGVAVTRATDGTGSNSGDATKNWLQPSISITKSPKTQTFGSGGTATFTIVVTNNGPITLLNVHVTDPLSPNCVRTAADIPALASMAPGASLSWTCTLANVTANFTNTATAIGSPQGGGPDVQASDTAAVTVTTSPPPPPPATPQNPAISITKNPKGQTIETGQSATFTIVVTNTGNTTLTNVTVNDPLSPNCNQSSTTITALASMAPGASVTYNCSLANVTASFTNVATTTGTPPSGPNVTASDSAPVNVTVPLTPPKPTPTHPAIAIVKSPNSQSIGVGGTATFTIKVTNTGDVTLTNVTVTDPLSTDCNKNLGTLGVGQSKSYSCTKEHVTAGFENVATVTGKPPTGASVSAKDNANVGVAAFTPPQHPAIGISKDPKSQTVTTQLKTTTTASGANKTTVTYGDAHFTIKVTNTGDVALHSVKVSDPLSPNCNKNIGTLAGHASKTYTCSKPAVTSNFTNVATATGISPKGVHVHATDSANVKVTTKTTSTSGAQFTG
jgi:uncharacterized repeat protein (TIGR01451 family)